MTCYHPIQGYIGRELTRKGKNKVVIQPHLAISTAEPYRVTLSCKRCYGCRLDYSRNWAIRCMHEAGLYSDNCFVTLTYNDENLPSDYGLNKKHFQDFMKRLRKHIEDTEFRRLRDLYANGKRSLVRSCRKLAKKNVKSHLYVRYYHAGEYGDSTGRPHYHALLFNYRPDDLLLYSNRPSGESLYVSPILEKIWGMGFVTVGNVTFNSAAYCARYIMKKQLGNGSEFAYSNLDVDTGEILFKQKEYCTMSRKPGLGGKFFMDYKDDIYPSDFVVYGRNNELRCRPPKYYDTLIEKADPAQYEMILTKRELELGKLLPRIKVNSTPERLAARERCKIKQTATLLRSLDSVHLT